MFEKLEGYREQLQQVEALLADAPDEPSLLKLKQDLTEVITLTEDLVRYQDEEKKVEETAPAPVQAKGRQEVLSDGRVKSCTIPAGSTRRSWPTGATSAASRGCR